MPESFRITRHSELPRLTLYYEEEASYVSLAYSFTASQGLTYEEHARIYFVAMSGIPSLSPGSTASK